MITGAHFLLYSRDAEADRAFFRDILSFPAIEIGGSWLIFGMSPAELAIHPADRETEQPHGDDKMLDASLYLMCDDLDALMASLAAKNVPCAAMHTERRGTRTAIQLPSGGQIGLYPPTHPTALHLKSKRARTE